ncbi:MAG: DUF4403 family protein [Flavisolibacter sp.]
MVDTFVLTMRQYKQMIRQLKGNKILGFPRKRLFASLPCLLASLLMQAQSLRDSKAGIDSLPASQIDIPIQVNLDAIYRMAERKVDTVFTSPHYPNDWVQSDCATRYKYHFRRSPLRMSMSGTILDLGFTGFYQITGSTRACLNGTVLSPWTPSCRCGFEEAERRVNVGFTSSFSLLPNLVLHTKITRKEPQPLDKCAVCFWGQDVTTSVMEGLKAELDLSKKAMEDSFGTMNLRPFMQQAWNMMNDVYAIPNIGYFSLHPKSLRMENINASNHLLNINLGITAAPVVSFEKPEAPKVTVPDLTTANHPGGFNIYLEAALQYDSLSKVLNGYLAGKRFDLSEGIFNKHIVMENTMVGGDENGNLLIRVDFSGSFEGTVFLTGKPFYNPEKKTIEVQELDYDLRTRNLLLKTAKWLFNKRIISELKKYSSFELTDYYKMATTTLNTWLNREWTPGIKGAGQISALSVTGVHALPEHLLIRSNCVGKLTVLVSEIDLKF